MGDITNVGGTGASQPLTEEQQQALKRLHQASTQLEGVFMQMVMNAMEDTVPKDSIFGKEDASEETWQSMLNDQRAQAIAESGSLGIGRILEQQMRNQVLADAHHESHVDVERRTEP
jgi:flagellar protein FlgJ